MGMLSKAEEILKEKKLAVDLERLYTNLNNPSSFGSPRQLYLQVRRVNDYATQKRVNDWLKKSVAYTRHRRVYVNFPRRKVIVKGIDRQWQADLIDMQAISSLNKRYKYILIVIDVFSRKAWAQPMKSKHSSTTVNAFKEILKRADGRRPEKLQTDDGKEFVGAPFQKFIRENKIIWFSTNMIMKAQIAERFNRTLKNIIHQYMTYTGKLRYIDSLQKFLDVYNSRSHRSLGGIAPNDVTLKNQKKVFAIQYGAYLGEKEKFKWRKSKFCVGDTVRLSKYRDKFARGFKTNYTSEIFRVNAVQKTHPVTYRVETVGDGEKIDGAFYGRELVAVSN